MCITKTQRIFQDIKSTVNKEFDMDWLYLKLCPDAEDDYLTNGIYAHVFCDDYISICVCPQIETIPDENIRAILWREFGRLIGGVGTDDNKADKLVAHYFGIKIKNCKKRKIA